MIFPSYCRMISCEFSFLLFFFSSFCATPHFIPVVVAFWHLYYRHCIVICIFCFFFQLNTFVSKAYKQLSIFHSIFQHILTQWSKSQEEKESMVKKLEVIVNSTERLKRHMKTVVRGFYSQ